MPYRRCVTDDELIAGARARLASDAPPPASPDELAEAEKHLGFALPALLRRTGWPEGLVAVRHWGCAIWSCIDCNSEDGRVIRFDPDDYVGGDGASWSGAWTVERPTLAAFLADWLQDRLPSVPDSPQSVCPTPAGFSPAWRV
jgi:hypothetical protein